MEVPAPEGNLPCTSFTFRRSLSHNCQILSARDFLFHVDRDFGKSSPVLCLQSITRLRIEWLLPHLSLGTELRGSARWDKGQVPSACLIKRGIFRFPYLCVREQPCQTSDCMASRIRFVFQEIFDEFLHLIYFWMVTVLFSERKRCLVNTTRSFSVIPSTISIWLFLLLTEFDGTELTLSPLTTHT